MMKIIRNVAVAENAPYLLALTILIGLMPKAVIVAGAPGFAVGTACFILNLAICAVGFLSGRFRLLWALWALASGLSFALFGMASPLGLILVLPSISAR